VTRHAKASQTSSPLTLILDCLGAAGSLHRCGVRVLPRRTGQGDRVLGHPDRGSPSSTGSRPRL